METAARERLRILMLEDDPDDAALIQRALAKTIPGASVRWTRTRADFVKELDDFSPHLVLADYKLPSFDGLSALSLVKKRAPETPFILISGTIGEEMAVEALKSGATDYVLKNHLERLEIVLTRALRERRERMKRLKAEAALFETQTQLLQSQKMEALGRLSGGVAHDFNNILTAITGYGELALLNPKLEEGLRGDIQEILNAAFRAAALTRQLLAFSRRQIFAPKILNLNRSLTELDRMLQRIIGEDIKLTIVPAADLQHVQADADQIGQVVLNLVVNARDAMPKGGTLALRTANVELGKEDLRAQPDVRPGRFVMLSVEDSGEGMDAETMSLIFEPFFTTKSKDKGTGLGLATVYGIVKQSNGFIEVDSRLGSGTIFRIYLPAVEGKLDAVRKVPVPKSLKGSETILVVDDDAAVGIVVRRILESQGYSVIEAHGGEEALRRCADSGKPVDLVLSDVVMSEMNGPELARRLKTVRPACKILFASGYAEGATTEVSALKGHFISKPFSVEDLIKKVRQILDAPPP
jgi:signal transduction histidine kinase